MDVRLRATLVLALSWAPAAMALQPLITDDTGTQGTAGNQIELAYNRERAKSQGQTDTTRALGSVYTRGLTDTLDLYVGANYLDIRAAVPEERSEGMGNPALGFKWRFWEADAGLWSVAWKPEVQFGLSAQKERRGLGTGRNSYASTFIVTRETAFGAVHANLAAQRVGYQLSDSREDERRMLYRLSLAPVVDLSPTWKAAVDAGVMTNPDRSRRARMGYVELGAIWSPHEDFEVALGWIAQRGDGEPRVRTLTGGITWRFR